MARLLLKPVSMPLMAVPIRVTATMPMMTPSAVRIERILFARICVIAMRKDSMNSLKRRCMAGRGLVLTDVGFDQTVAQAHDAAGGGGGCRPPGGHAGRGGPR